MKEDAEKKTDRSRVIKELEDRLLKKWKADQLSKDLPLQDKKPAYLKTNKEIPHRGLSMHAIRCLKGVAQNT